MLVSLLLLSTPLPIALQGPPRPPATEKPSPRTPWELLSARYDKDGDGRVQKAEYPRGEVRFRRLDRNEDGVLTAEDWKVRRTRRPTPPAGRPPREGTAPARRTPRPDPAPKAGELAPDFDLPRLRVKEPEDVRLSSFRGKKPVALIFGSYT